MSTTVASGARKASTPAKAPAARKTAATKPAPATSGSTDPKPAKPTTSKPTAPKPSASKPSSVKAAVAKAPAAKPATPEAAKAPAAKAPQKSASAKVAKTPLPVALVAAGPGDPDLMSVRGARLLGAADLIVTDAGAADIAHAFAGARTEVVVAVDAAGVPLDQAGRAALVVEGARAQRVTVRLLAGDPVLDGSLLPEAAALRKAKISFEIAPAVSDVTGIPAYAGYTLTGGRTRGVRIVDANDTDLPWPDLATPRTTVVFVNGADRAGDIAGRLLSAGADAGTLTAVTRNGTTVDQRTVVSTLGEVAGAAADARASGPGLLVVGEVVSQREKLDWFETKALFGWRVLVPRTQDHAGPILSLLRGHGAVPVEVPTISVEPPRTPQQIDRAVHGLVSGRYEWIGFTSVNAVRAIREKLVEYGLDARSFAGLKVAAVGEPTVASLVEFGVRPDIVASGEQTTAALLDEWPAYDSLVDPINRVFLPRADIATDTLAAGLGELGWEVDDVTAYRTVRAAPPAAATREAIKTGGFDAVLFTSSSTVRNLVGIAGKPHHTTVVACIGPQTAKAAEEHGLRVDVLADVSTVTGLIEALAAHGEALRAAATEAGEAAWQPSRRRAAPRRKAT